MHDHLRSTQSWALSVLLCVAAFAPAPARAQDSVVSSALPDAPVPHQTTPPANDTSLQGKQTKRILGIIPNFRAVSVNQKLPPETIKEKFIGATQDSFDYSAFVWAGMLAGVSMAEDSYPQFGEGAEGYGQYYWHTFVDQAQENYWVEFVLPAALHQDPRYYTLGHGGIIKRTAYSFSRVLITRTDAGNNTFNASEIVGAGAAAGISGLYYPAQERGWTKTGQRWLVNVSLDGGTFIFKEFWPDINSAIFHQKQ